VGPTVVSISHLVSYAKKIECHERASSPVRRPADVPCTVQLWSKAQRALLRPAWGVWGNAKPSGLVADLD
jgi:hypothetical protein